MLVGQDAILSLFVLLFEVSVREHGVGFGMYTRSRRKRR
jgi:hypothetical protein